ncbi:hypothetical protein L873DRAFT_351211 [Choiromyces venosus 120613-1]|uniref:Uncharacterized protein n=1 Tax=Choiromyces venosus 120613-1 TaxID=1336337 RepID=A0A3N4IYZ7_9PEZI|nr:hypothetical protein L873DRAFT_351211 [Choiromyces venosus 120613-1]
MYLWVLASIFEFISKFTSRLSTIVTAVITIIYDYFKPNSPAPPCLPNNEIVDQCAKLAGEKILEQINRAMEKQRGQEPLAGAGGEAGGAVGPFTAQEGMLGGGAIGGMATSMSMPWGGAAESAVLGGRVG